MTSSNDPVVSASTDERASLARSRYFGVATTSGVRASPWTWRRRRWKYWAAVVALTTWRLSSADRVRNRSMRAEECSGPCPS
jgi:hypothetical protein